MMNRTLNGASQSKFNSSTKADQKKCKQSFRLLAFYYDNIYYGAGTSLTTLPSVPDGPSLPETAR